MTENGPPTPSSLLEEDLYAQSETIAADFSNEFTNLEYRLRSALKQVGVNVGATEETTDLFKRMTDEQLKQAIGAAQQIGSVKTVDERFSDPTHHLYPGLARDKAVHPKKIVRLNEIVKILNSPQTDVPTFKQALNEAFRLVSRKHRSFVDPQSDPDLLKL